MRSTLAVVALLFGMSSSIRAQDRGVRRTTVIADSGIGALTLGLSTAQVKERCHVVLDTSRDNWDHVERMRVLLVTLGRDTVLAWVSSDSVLQIDVTSRSLRTRDSLGVGTRLATLLKRPNPTGATGKASTWVSLPGHCGLLFVLSGGGSGEDGAEYSAQELRTWSRSIRVTAIQIVGCQARAP